MIKIIDSSQTTRKLSKKEQLAGENVMQQCMALRPGEKVLIVTDMRKQKIEAPIFFETAKKFTPQVRMVVIKPTGEHGVEPSKKAADLMLQSDVILAPTTYSLTHTHAREKACKKGARIASMPGITKNTILRTLTMDYHQVAALSKKIAGLLTIAQRAELASPSGTNMVFDLKGRDGITDTGLFTNNGDYGNLPAGEGLIAPVEGKSKGILVFEAAYGDKPLSQPVAFEVKKGLVTKACYKKKAEKEIEAALNQIGPEARNIAELGIGTNKMASLKGGILELEKIYGTCHVALGNNAFFGGEVDVPYHVDGLIINPTLKLDNQTILKNGKFVI